MNDLMALVAIFTGLCLVLGLAGWASDCWLDRNKDVLPPPDPTCERDGSIESFYRRNGSM
jgi:hypothetical protein